MSILERSYAAMKKKLLFCIVAVLIIALVILFSSPTRAIRISAVLHGCDRAEVMDTEFELHDAINSFTYVYRAVDTVLADNLTGSGHQTWYVYKVLFVNIPVWAGNG